MKPLTGVARYDERAAGGDRVAHRRLLDVRRHYPDRAKLGGDLGQRRNTRAVDAIVVAHQDSHALMFLQDCGHRHGMC